MRVPEPILTAHLLAPLNEELIALLRGLSTEEWDAHAVGAWSVRDVAAHLLDSAMRRLSFGRDGLPPAASFDPNAMNREWVAAMRRLSPRVLTELLGEYGRQQAEYLASLDPHAKAMWPVSWAGDDRSPVWFDVARELTERWHHQQQIRDAAGRAPLYEDRFFGPVIDTFARGLPQAYRDTQARDGTTVVLHVTGEGEGAWSLVRESDRWRLYAGESDADATVRVRGDSAWRMFTRAQPREAPQVEGDVALAQPLLKMTCVI
jgi:uncharacterized protein (TIGR03083 family)